MKKKILVVDPDQSAFLALHELFVGDQLILAESGSQAEGIIRHTMKRHSCPDLVILEAVIGAEACKSLADFCNTLAVPTVMLAAKPEIVEDFVFDRVFEKEDYQKAPRHFWREILKLTRANHAAALAC